MNRIWIYSVLYPFNFNEFLGNVYRANSVVSTHCNLIYFCKKVWPLTSEITGECSQLFCWHKTNSSRRSPLTTVMPEFPCENMTTQKSPSVLFTSHYLLKVIIRVYGKFTCSLSFSKNGRIICHSLRPQLYLYGSRRDQSSQTVVRVVMGHWWITLAHGRSESLFFQKFYCITC